MSAELAALVACVVLGALGILQVALASGAPLGRFVWGGQHRVLPARLRIGSAASVLVYVAMGILLLARADAAGEASRWLVVGAWILTGYFAVGVVVNAISRSRAERFAMTPTCAVLAALSAVVAVA